MKILSNKTFNDLMNTLVEQDKVIKRQNNVINKLNNDIRLLNNKLNIKFDVIFPNTDERGLGEPDTPIDISDIFSL